MKPVYMWRSAFVLLMAGSLLLASCRKNTDVVPATPATDMEVNDWILSNMQTYYYWNTKLPANPDKSLTPDKFFTSILNTYDATANPNGDRFSWIQQSADELKAALSGESKTDGLEFKLYLLTGDFVIGKVIYVQKNSPAAKAGFMRGDVFYQINGQTLTKANYTDLLNNSGDTKTYTLAKIENNTIINTTNTRQTTAVVYQANPVYLDSVYVLRGKTIGYFVYNQFATGPTGPSDHTYDNQVDAVFARFKTKGVTDLVLDFRYNPGGYVSAATNLASSVAKGVDGTKVFYRKEYNATLTTAYRDADKKSGTDSFTGFFSQKAGSIGNSLQNVIVLTTSGTASASELVINGLKPFMPVATIGTTTYGKNVGSITISDNTGRIKWGMQPIVTKSFNSLGQSDYSTGFTPTVEVKEYTNGAWKQLGDISEPLLNEAIVRITGSGRIAASPVSGQPNEIGSSIERKAGGSNMFFDQKLPSVH